MASDRLWDDDRYAGLLLEALHRLQKQLKGSPDVPRPDREAVDRVIQHGRLMFVWDWNLSTQPHRLVGMGTLAPVYKLDRIEGRIESVVVDADYRGRAIGQEIMGRLIDEARRLQLHSLELTSHSGRKAAIHIYESLGFVRRDTNVLSLVLSSPEP